MRNITESLKKAKSRLSKRADIWLLVEVSAVLLLMTIAANYVMQYIREATAPPSSLVSWEYIYTNSAEPPASSSAQWEMANAFSPMSKEKTGAYLHMRGTLDGQDSDRALVIKTDYAPLRVSLNGEAVYNNHYGKSAYTGNRYNAVTIPTSTGRVTVAISAQLPFSAEMEMNVRSGTGSAISLNGGMVFSAVLLALGVLLALSTGVLMVTKKKRPYGLVLAALTIVYAVAVALPAIADGSYWLNAPHFYNASVAANIGLVLLFAWTIRSVLKIKNKFIGFCLLLGVAATIAMVFVSRVWLLKLAVAGITVLSALAMAMTAQKCSKLLRRRIQYTKGFFVMMLFLTALDVVCGVIQLTLRYRVDFTYCLLIGEFMMLCFMGFVLSIKTMSDSNPEAIAIKTAVRVQSVTRVADIMKRVLSSRSEIDVCKTAADGVRELCCDIFTETDADKLAYVVAMKDGEEYQEICNRLLDEQVNYAAVENRCMDSQQFCFFTETYFEFVFLKKNDFYIIFHFENIKNGLSSFFTSIMSVLYSCLEVALDQLAGDVDIEQREIEAFTKLATDTEVASGNNHDHLERVAYYTKVIMEKMGYSAPVCDMVSQAAMLHDIGKTAVPFEITNKAGLLSESERDIMKQHTAYGYALLSAFHSDFMQCAAEIAAEHHERYDGTGYSGKAGDSINEYARIVTVADTLDALSTKRSYKEAWPFDAVIAYIDSHSGTMFDPKVVSAMHEGLDVIRTAITEKSK